MAHIFAKFVLLEMNYDLKLQYKDATSYIMRLARHGGELKLHDIRQWVKDHVEPIDEEMKMLIKEKHYRGGWIRWNAKGKTYWTFGTAQRYLP